MLTTSDWLLHLCRKIKYLILLFIVIPSAHCYLDSLQRMISGCIPDINLKGVNLVALYASTDDNQIEQNTN